MHGVELVERRGVQARVRVAAWQYLKFKEDRGVWGMGRGGAAGSQDVGEGKGWMELFCKLQKKQTKNIFHCSKIRKKARKSQQP